MTGTLSSKSPSHMRLLLNGTCAHIITIYSNLNSIRTYDNAQLVKTSKF